MVGKTFTYLIGSDAAATFFNSKNEDLNAEEVYGKLVTPVFGKGVAYDVPNSVRCRSLLRVCLTLSASVNMRSWFLFQIFLEQKKMFKTGLNIARFRQHIPLIERETIDYFKRWGDSGQKGGDNSENIQSALPTNCTIIKAYLDLINLFRCLPMCSVCYVSVFLFSDLFRALSELIILTASRCLHGMNTVPSNSDLHKTRSFHHMELSFLIGNETLSRLNIGELFVAALGQISTVSRPHFQQT